MDVFFSCPCTACTTENVKHPMFEGLDLAGAQSLLQDPNVLSVLSCGDCGCELQPVDNTTSIGMVDVSKPTLSAVSPANDVVTGGAAITLTGHRLDLGSLVVKFNGEAGLNLRSRTESTAIVDAPAGSIRLVEIGERQRKLDFTNLNGTFQVGETLTGQSHGGSMRVAVVDTGHLMVETVRGQIEAGEQFTGDVSGALATCSTLHPDFQLSETVQGDTSNATAVLQTADAAPDKLLRADTFSGQFSADEWIEGLTTGARVQLSSTPQDGSVVVSVENENGLRSPGGSLYGAFDYTLL